MMGLIYIIFGIVAVVGGGLALTGRGRYLIKGLTNLFFVDVAKTPKGANAIYTQAIEEASDSYTKASNNFQRIAGLLDTAQNNQKDTSDKLILTKQKMEDFAKRQMFEKVELFAQELANIDEDLSIYTAEIAKYTPMYQQAKLLTENYEQKLIKLKKDKKTVVRQLEMNQQAKEMYDDLDQLKNVKTSDKLLESVKEGVIDTGEMATGARILHENKHSTKMLEAESEVKAVKYNSYVEELKQKYSK